MDSKIIMVAESIKKLLKIFVRTPMPRYRKEKLRKILLRLNGVFVCLKEKKSNRSVWVRPIYSVEQRFYQGDSDNLLITLRTTDPALHFNYLRINVDIFDKLLSIVGPELEKQYCIREPISSITRLQICLRYLASGDSMKSVEYAFRVAPNTVAQIIQETCNVMYGKN